MSAWAFLIVVYAAFALAVLVLGARSLLRNVAARAARSAEHAGWMAGHATGADLHRKGERIKRRGELFAR